jgi:hypothetical protein
MLECTCVFFSFRISRYFEIYFLAVDASAIWGRDRWISRTKGHIDIAIDRTVIQNKAYTPSIPDHWAITYFEKKL